LKISLVGFTPQKKNIELSNGQQLIVNINLKEDVLQLNEAVVVGYGTQIKKEVSSSISSIRGEDIEGKPVYNVASSLQGKAAGVQVTTDNGMAGAGTTVRIRGTKTLSNQPDPLYVIDGIPVYNRDISDAGSQLGYNTSPLSLINPNDIESMEILKDAAATAIYGARGANGVVIITTKSGKSGKTKFNIDYTSGISTETNRLKMLDADEYMELYYEAYLNDVEAGLIDSNNTSFEEMMPYGISPDSVANTDWIDEMLRIGNFHDINLSASGGNDKLNFYVGGSLRDENSFIVGNAFQRASFRANLKHQATENLSFGYNTSLTRTQNEYAPSGWAGGLGMAQSAALPIYPIYNSDGSYFQPSNGVNPVAQLDLWQLNNVSYRTLNSFNVEYKFLKDFAFRNELGIDFIDQHETFFKPEELTGSLAQAADRRVTYYTWNVNSTLGYKKSFLEKHKFEALIGFNPTKTIEKFAYIQGSDFPTDQFTEVQGAGTIDVATAGTGRQFAFISYFSRVNYVYSEKYLLQLSARTDGSSRFGSQNKYGTFPSASFGWILSEENFLQGNKLISFLKLRTSIGSSGNAELSDDFAQYSFYSTGQDYGGESGIGPSNISVDDLSWETTIKEDIGIDYSFGDGRISGTLEFYNENTNDLLIQNYPVSPSSGYSSIPAVNIGKLYNRGFEFQVTSNNLKPNRKLGWKTDFNIAAYQNKITDLGDVEEVSGTNYGENRAIVGYPVGIFMLAEYAGIDPESGEILIYDLQGNKVVLTAANSVSERKPMGQPYPKFFGGMNNSFSYKNFSLDIFIVYSYGQSIYDDAGKRMLGNMGFGWNQVTNTLARWQETGDVTDIPKLSINSNYDLNCSKYLYDASYIRMRNVTFSYQLPASLLQKLKLLSCKLFISGQNLYVFTKYPGWDPEVNRDGSGAITQGVTYLSPPQARIISTGIKLGF
jgi:TonB-linked SusC/RagA family outer membrane protein